MNKKNLLKGLTVLVLLGLYSQNIFANSEISAGHDHTCSIETNTATSVKNIYCWGSNQFGQLGRVTTGSPQQDKGIVKFPASNPSLTPTDIATGVGHSCAVASGKAYCWGHNNLGQLGNNLSTDSSFPVLVLGLPTGVAVSKVFASLGDVSCALMSDKRLYCWGDQYLGGVGNGVVPVDSTVARTKKNPELIASNVIDVSLGVYHGCLLESTSPSSNKMKCWGDNSDGELGRGTASVGEPTPGDVLGDLSGVSLLSIAAGADHTCAIKPGAATRGMSNGGPELYCWGQNQYQQLGVATTAGYSSTPLFVANIFITNNELSSEPNLSAGVHHTCALVKASSSGSAINCWGRAQEGQLGRSLTTTMSLPIGPVSNATSGVTNFSTGGYHTCFKKGADIFCVGSNQNAQISLAAYKTAKINPLVPNVSLGSPLVLGLQKVAAGSSHACGIKGDGTVKCWGANGYGQLGNGTTNYGTSPVSVTGLIGVSTIVAGENHSCALINNGTVKCWGYNFHGQLGNGSNANALIPVSVTGLTGVSMIAGGGSNSCALLNNGTVKCWGGFRALGTTTDTWTPVTITGYAGASAISIGLNHSCALINDGKVKCLGQNTYGQLGNGTTTNAMSPTPVTGLTGVSMIATGALNSCALLNTGTVKCWGSNGYGQLGNGTTTDAISPTSVTGLTGVSMIATGYGHSCALINTGSVKCWGNGLIGQLGNGNMTSSPSPVAVAGLTGVSVIASGSSSNFTFTMSSSGILKAWGDNNYFQLGLDPFIRLPLLISSGGTSDG